MAVAALVTLAAGCGDASVASPGVAPDGGAVGCSAGEIARDAGCVAAGVPPDGCGAGFAADGAQGCVAVLPVAACALGEIAVPGDTACRAVAPCDAGRWGAAPRDAGTVFVDGAYTGGASDGSEEHPWTAIQEAIEAAAPGAVVAIAAGSYAEDLGVVGKAVRLWGACPAAVAVVGQGGEKWALQVLAGADGTEVHDLALTGPLLGFGLSGAAGVVLDRVWIHDTGDRGVDVEDTLGTTSVSMSGCLVEATAEVGVFLSGVEASVEASAVRDTRPATDGRFGWGLTVERSGVTFTGSHASIVGSLVEGSRGVGLMIEGSEATVDGCLVRRTDADETQGGRGLVVQAERATGERATVSVLRSVVEASGRVGLYVGAADATIEATVVRGGTPPRSGARGVSLEDGDVSNLGAAVVTLRSSLVENVADIGILVSGSALTMEATRVRGVVPDEATQAFGRGVSLQPSPAQRRSTMLLTGSVVEDTHELGVYVLGSDALVETTRVFGTHEAPGDRFGDGIAAAVHPTLPTTLAVERSRVEASARAGLATFGAPVSVGGTVFECNVIALAGQDVAASAFSLVDEGGNVCGCSGVSEACKVLVSEIAAPEPR